MTQKRINRILPTALGVISAIWIALLICPLLYSVIFPASDTRQLIRELEGHGAVPSQLDPLVQHAGLVKRAIPVKKYWHFSGDYSIGHSHATMDTQLSYIACFQKLPKAALLVITRTEAGSETHLRITVDTQSPFSVLWIYYVPFALLASSLLWLWNSHRSAKQLDCLVHQEAAEREKPNGRQTEGSGHSL